MKPVTYSHVLRPPRNLNAIFSGTELQVVELLVRIMNSSKFKGLRTMYQHRQTGGVTIEGVDIYYEENEDNPCGNNRPAFTNISGSNPGFHLFCDAWISRSELIKTVAHELHRLRHSTIRTTQSLSAGDPLKETRDAEAFSIAVSEIFQ